MENFMREQRVPKGIQMAGALDFAYMGRPRPTRLESLLLYFFTANIAVTARRICLCQIQENPANHAQHTFAGLLSFYSSYHILYRKAPASQPVEKQPSGAVHQSILCDYDKKITSFL